MRLPTFILLAVCTILIAEVTPPDKLNEIIKLPDRGDESLGGSQPDIANQILLKNQVQIGDTKEAVIEKLGSPTGSMKLEGDSYVICFRLGDVTLRRNIVIAVDLITEDEYALKKLNEAENERQAKLKAASAKVAAQVRSDEAARQAEIRRQAELSRQSEAARQIEAARQAEITKKIASTKRGLSEQLANLKSQIKSSVSGLNPKAQIVYSSFQWQMNKLQEDESYICNIVECQDQIIELLAIYVENSDKEIARTELEAQIVAIKNRIDWASSVLNPRAQIIINTPEFQIIESRRKQIWSSLLLRSQSSLIKANLQLSRANR